MTDKQFILNIEDSNITVRGGYMNRMPEHSGSIQVDEDIKSIDLLVREGIKLEGFEAEIQSHIKKRSMSSYLVFLLKNKLGSLITIFISLLVIILIALLSIHGSLTYDLFSDKTSPNIFNFNSVYFYLLLSLIILLFLIISPKIILGDYDNLFDWVNARFSNRSRIIRKLVRELEALHKLGGQEVVFNLWNPLVAGRENWVCRQLLPALSRIAPSVNIMIKGDEKEALLDILKDSEIEVDNTKQMSGRDPEVKKAFPYSYLSAWEKECMHCLIFSSTKHLPDSWEGKSAHQSIIVSRELAEQVYHIHRPKLASSIPGNTSFEKFVTRCMHDYRYLDAGADQRTQNLVLLDHTVSDKLEAALIEELEDSVRNNISSISAENTDPLAFIILIGLMNAGNALNTRKINLVSGFIRNVKRVENYQLMSTYWEYISSNESGEEGSFKLGPLQFMDVQTLSDLSACFVNSGMYDHAMEVFSILENIYPAKIAIEIADLKDSLGEYREALEILLKTDEEWVRSGIIEDMGLILELYLNISWVIVSGRFEDRRDEGYRYLEKTETILRKLPDTENYLLFLTRFYNTRANYHEWEENYELAIENYEKALKLPGTILRKSSLLSNRGISERLIGKKCRDKADQKKHLMTSRSNIRQAVNMKKSIGEKNQIPGTSHNLAETLLELASTIEEKAEKISVLKEADEVTSQALAILDELNSQKRRGRLLAEKCIAHHMLGQLGEESDATTIMEKLNTWLEKEDKESYDYREITRLLKRFNISK